MSGFAQFWADGDVVARAVAALLLAMSVSVWMLIFWKGWLLRRTRRDIERGVAAFWAAPALDLMTSGLQLELPRSDAAQPTTAPALLAVTIAPDGALLLGGERLEREALAARVAAAAAGNAALEVHLRADRAVPYGRVAELVGLEQQAGLNRIAFVTEPEALR